jgi:SAM-dependent methyltransferase
VKSQWAKAARSVIPKPLRPPIRWAYLTITQYYRRLVDPLTPPDDGFYSTMAGDYQKIGHDFRKLLISIGNLTPDDAVLDVGCGNGRMAVPLTSYLSPKGRYEGFDVIKSGVGWCSANISPRFPSFQFRWVDVKNGNYNPNGQTDPAQFRFPYADGSFDFVFLSSVFTHMLPEDIVRYLAEIFRLLRNGGRVFATFFIVSTEQCGVESIGTDTLILRQQPAGYFARDPEDPAAAIGFDEATVRDWFRNTGFMVIEPIHFGVWSGRTNGVSYQDIIVAVKQGLKPS